MDRERKYLSNSKYTVQMDENLYIFLSKNVFISLPVEQIDWKVENDRAQLK